MESWVISEISQLTEESITALFELLVSIVITSIFANPNLIDHLMMYGPP